MRKINRDVTNLEKLFEKYHGNFEITEEVLSHFNKLYTGEEQDSCTKKSEILYNRKIKILNIIKHKRLNGVSAGSIKEGFIYVASNPAYPSRYKIGRTLEPYDRITAFNVLCPDKAWKLEAWFASFASFDMRKAEESILNLLRSPNCKGEWTGRKLNTIRAVLKHHHHLDNWENLPDSIKFKG